MKQNYRLRSLLAAIAAVAGTPLAHADAPVQGRVSDQSGDAFFQGAQVAIPSLGMETRTDDSGRYFFSMVPTGNHELVVSYVGAPDARVTLEVASNPLQVDVRIGDNVGLMENMIVVGQSAGLASALNRQRTADNTVSIVSSDFIGQFPDENVTEALQRVSGVFIERDQGEGRFVGVRGVNPQLNVATINGLNVPSPENDTRSVALDVIPSDLLEELRVSKTLTPDMDGDAIGGSIDIKSLTAFDRDGLSYKLTGQGIYNELEEGDGYKLSGTFTNVFDLAAGELGVALALSSQDKDFGTDNLEVDGAWNNDFEGTGIRAHEEIETRNYTITRERDGYALNLDYRPNDNSEYYVRSLYSEFSDQEYRNRIEFKLDRGEDEDLLPGDPGMGELGETSLVRTDTRLERELKDRFEEQTIISLLLGGENRLDQWTLAYAFGTSTADEEQPYEYNAVFRNSGVDYAGYTSLGHTPTIVMSENAYAYDEFELNEIELVENYTEDDETTWRIDLTRDLSSGFIQFGAKLREREKTQDGTLFLWEDFDDWADDQGVAEPTLADFPGGNTDYSLADFGWSVSPTAVRSFINLNRDSFILADADTELGSALDYTMNEDIDAFYLLHRLDLDAWRFVYGVRYEQTDFEARGQSGILDDDEGEIEIRQTRYRNDYSHLLPSLNVRYKPSEEMILRAAYSRSISRPSFGDLNPTPEEITIEDDELVIVAGNPELEAYESDNFDFSVEYYPAGIGALSAGIFYKQIDNFVFTADVTDSVDPARFVGDYDLTGIDVDEIIMPLNGGSADLSGLELGWSRSWNNGLLLMLNGTWTDSDADLKLEERGNISLPFQADFVGNAVLGYEMGGLSLRLSAATVSERIIEVDGEEPSNDVYEDTHTQLDFTGKYDLTDQLQLFFSVVNLTEEPNYRYQGSSRYNQQYDEIGRTFTFGVTLRNL